MTGKEIAGIIIAFCLTSWIPISFLFDGIAYVIRAIKGNDTNHSDADIDIVFDDLSDKEDKNE